MADNYLYAQRPDPFSSFMQGFQGGQNIMTNMSRNNLMQEHAQREKLLTAMKLHDEMKGMTYDNLDFYNQTYRPALLKLGVPEGFLPPVDSVDKLNELLYKNEQIKAMYKQKMEGPKVVPPMGSVFSQGNFLYPQNPAFQAQLQQRQAEEQGRGERQQAGFGFKKEFEDIQQGNRLGLIRERAEKAPKEFAPQMIDTENGPAWSYPNGRVVPIPGGLGKVKAGATDKQRMDALKLTNDQMIYPDNPIYEERFQENLRRVQGKKSAPNKYPTTGEFRMYQGKKYPVIIRDGKKGIDTDNPLED